MLRLRAWNVSTPLIQEVSGTYEMDSEPLEVEVLVELECSMVPVAHPGLASDDLQLRAHHVAYEVQRLKNQ